MENEHGQKEDGHFMDVIMTSLEMEVEGPIEGEVELPQQLDPTTSPVMSTIAGEMSPNRRPY